MDQFGVLVESIGFKSQRSTPLANLKGKTTSTATTAAADPFPPSFGKPSTNSSSFAPNFVVDDLDGIFRSNSTRSNTNNDFDDIFGGGSNVNNNKKPPSSGGVGNNGGSFFDFDSAFRGSSNLGHNDDLFGGMPGLKSYGSNNFDGDLLFGGMPSKKSNSVDDLFGSFEGMGLNSNGSSRNGSGKKQENGFKSDDLIPGFGGSSPSSNGAKPETRPSPQSNCNSAKPFATPVEDPFVMLERTQGKAGGGSGSSEVNDLDSFFASGKHSTAAPSQKPATEDSVFDALFHNTKGPKVEVKSFANPNSKKKASPTQSTTDDFSYLFGMGAAPSSGEFQEVEGESGERRRARLNHHKRTQERMAKVLNEKNQRDLQTQREQEERHRLAETLDDGIKRWAAGKEGNLRALLSSLQYVLWSECGWQPVSLTDLITSTSVKKVYYKATLCVHPDKVQQKGFNLEQKYTAEKVFDILKEAWNKFNAEELKKR